MDEKKWVVINNFSDKLNTLKNEITGIYEIENEIYLIGSYEISTFNDDVYNFPQDKYYEVKTSCRIGNNLLVVREYGEEAVSLHEFNLLDTKSKQVSNLIIETNKNNFAAVEFLNHLRIVVAMEY